MLLKCHLISLPLLQRQFQLIFFSLPSAANTRTVLQRFLLDTTAQAAQVHKKLLTASPTTMSSITTSSRPIILTNTGGVCQAKSGSKKPLAFWRVTEKIQVAPSYCRKGFENLSAVCHNLAGRCKRNLLGGQLVPAAFSIESLH